MKKHRYRVKSIKKKKEEILSSLGAKKISRGCYARVYRTADGDIAKVFDPNEDHSYDRFLSFIAKNQDDPHLPKIRAIHKIDAKSGGTSKIVIMEKLKHCRKKADDMTVVGGSNYYQDFLHIPDYHKLLIKLGKIADKTGSYFDIHEENIMFRGKEWVITDPLAPL